MIITNKEGYEIHINQYNKVDYILVGTYNGVERIHPYKWDKVYNSWTNVSGDYSYNYVQRLYRKGKLIYK